MTDRGDSAQSHTATPSGRALHRRGMLAAVAALAAGGLAQRTARPAAAGTDGDLVLNTTNTGTATTTLTGSQVSSPFTLLVLNGTAPPSAGSGGVALRATGGSPGTSGAGGGGIVATGGDALGAANAPGNGVVGTGGDTNNAGVTPGVGVGGQGGSQSGTTGTGGIGVRALGGNGGTSSGAGGAGIVSLGGNANNPIGAGGTGVIGNGGNPGTSSGAAGAGVVGTGAGANSPSGTGGVGVIGNGLQGLATTGAAVFGSGGSGMGVFGTSASGAGVTGTSANNNAVFGDASAAGNGVFARTVNGNGLVAQATGGGNAASFFGNVVVNGNFTVAPGFAKSGAVTFADGSVRRLYATEMPESWFEDVGEGQIVNGRASVPIPADFAQAVNTGLAYHVFAMPHTAEIEALAVTVRAADHFEVEANGRGPVNGTFSYRIVAKLRDTSGGRFERVTLPSAPLAPAADASSHLLRATEPPKLPEIPAGARQIPTVQVVPQP